MYEIFDMTGRMYIRVPYTENNKCRIELDRYNYIHEEGELDWHDVLVHIDGDYRNCDPENMYLARTGEIIRLNAMLSNAMDQEARDLCFVINDLIRMINQRCGYGYYSHYCLWRKEGMDPERLQKRRLKKNEWNSLHRDAVRQSRQAAYKKSMENKDFRALRNERQREYQRRRRQDPELRAKLNEYQRERRANESPEAREKRLARRRELRRLHKEEA